MVPGEPERTNDLVAEVRDEDHAARASWLVVEIEDEAEPGICWRMGQYAITLGKELNPRCDPAGPAVITLVVNLSGTQKTRRVAPAFRGGYGTGISPLVVDVAAQDAMRTLRRIEKGELGLTILPLLALMKGAGTPAFIGHWKAAVEREKDEGRRLSYREWAVILSELANTAVDWLKETEGWMERKSTIIEGWKKEGRDEGKLITKREDLLSFISARWKEPAPEAIRQAIEGTNDIAVLDRWIVAVATAQTLAALPRAMEIEG